MEPPQIEGPGEGSFTVYTPPGRHFPKMTITLSAVCVVLGGLARTVWDVSSYSNQQGELVNRVTRLEADNKAQGAALEDDKHLIAATGDRTVDLKAEVAALQVALGQAKEAVQKLSEANARLEERVIFLIAQIEGRMAGAPGGGGRSK